MTMMMMEMTGRLLSEYDFGILDVFGNRRTTTGWLHGWMDFSVSVFPVDDSLAGGGEHSRSTAEAFSFMRDGNDVVYFSISTETSVPGATPFLRPAT